MILGKMLVGLISLGAAVVFVASGDTLLGYLSVVWAARGGLWLALAYLDA